MTAKRTLALTWRAGPDLIAHAIRGRAPRTLCDRPAEDERWSWPELRRCTDCEAAAANSCPKHEWTWMGPRPEAGERCRHCGRVRDVARA